MDNIKGKNILLDTNILVYCGESAFGKEVQQTLRKLKDNGNNLCVSEMSCFELMKNTRDSLADYYAKLINYLPKVVITSEMLMNGASLYRIYRDRWKDNKNVLPQSGDMIISGTAILSSYLVLTADRKGFPEPFWKEIEHAYFVYKKDGKFYLINTYLLEFNPKAVPKDKLVEVKKEKDSK